VTLASSIISERWAGVDADGEATWNWARSSRARGVGIEVQDGEVVDAAMEDQLESSSGRRSAVQNTHSPLVLASTSRNTSKARKGSASADTEPTG